jgi:hypothetical protein
MKDLSMHLRPFLAGFRAALFLMMGASVFADPVSFTTVDGKKFEGVTVTRTMGRKLEVVTPTGTQLVRYKNLPREIQERFFDPSMLYPPKVGDLLDFKTLDGKEYKGPLREVTPNGISIGTPDGVDKVAYSQLPPELANSFDYDAEDAARYEAAMREHQRKIFIAKQAAAQKEAEIRAREQRNNQQPQPTPRQDTVEYNLGDRGSQQLGTPALGGRGLGR